jgi:uncharacterized protein YjbI with pentapeptide repeats
MIGAHLEDAMIFSTDWRHADLQVASFKGARLSSTNLSDANLEDARLSGAELIDCQLERAALAEAQMENTRLKRSSLAGADLRWVVFSDKTRLEDISLAEKPSKWKSQHRLPEFAALGGVRWNGVDVTQADLGGLTQLGDERFLSHGS